MKNQLTHHLSIPQRWNRVLTLTVVVTTLSGGVWLAWPWFHTHVLPAPPININKVVNQSIDHPDERDIQISDTDYNIVADQPRLLKLPRLQKQAYLQRINTDSVGRLVAPTNIGLAGWYINSAKPGEAGLSIIDGHVSGRYKPGVFKRLNELRPGDRIIVQYGNRSERQFTVTSSQQMSEQKASEVLFHQSPDIKSQLNLITCANYDRQTKSYRDRIIVVAKAH